MSEETIKLVAMFFILLTGIALGGRARKYAKKYPIRNDKLS